MDRTDYHEVKKFVLNVKISEYVWNMRGFVKLPKKRNRIWNIRGN